MILIAQFYRVNICIVYIYKWIIYVQTIFIHSIHILMLLIYSKILNSNISKVKSCLNSPLDEHLIIMVVLSIFMAINMDKQEDYTDP